MKIIKFTEYIQNQTMHPGGYGLFVRSDESETTLAGVIYNHGCREFSRDYCVPNNSVVNQVEGPENFDELLTSIDRLHILTKRYMNDLQ